MKRPVIDKIAALGFKLEFRNVGFYAERKTGLLERRKKISETRFDDKVNPFMTQSSRHQCCWVLGYV